MILFIDTETNGLPRNYKAPCTDLDNWPRITQLAFSVRSDSGVAQFEGQWLIKPDGWVIPSPELLAAQGSKDPMFFVNNNMSTERCEREGVHIAEALIRLRYSFLECHTIVAHNLDFDLPILQAELIRAGFPHTITQRQVCTMKLSVDICQLPGQYGFKWPKLTELVTWLGGTMEGAHDALNDVSACADCYFELRKRGYLEGGASRGTGIITHSNIRQFPATDFSQYIAASGYSHSFLKYEKDGVVEYKEATDKMRLGSLVDGLLTEPDTIRLTAHNQHLFEQAKSIATTLRAMFGSEIDRFEPQVNFAATMECDGMVMDTKGRLDWLLRGFAVLDLKVTDATSEDQMRKLIDFMGYRNALWNYCKMAGAKQAYIIPYSAKLNRCLSVIAIDCSGDTNEFWRSKVLKFGTVKQIINT